MGDSNEKTRNRSQKSDKSASLNGPNDYGHGRSSRQRQSTIPETDIECQREAIHLHDNHSRQASHNINNTAHSAHEVAAKTDEKEKDTMSSVWHDHPTFHLN